MLHPYHTLEIIALSIIDGLPSYLNWIQEICRGDADFTLLSTASKKPKKQQMLK